ncbi:MAG: hypothetical protein AAFO81_06330 [Pseudomonadota bacterium]
MSESGNGPEEVELDEYLEGDSELSRAYRQTTNAAPPSALDASILAAAHAQVPSGAPKKSRLLTLWEKPISIAAVMMLCAALVVSMQSADEVAPFGQPDAARREATSPAKASGVNAVAPDSELADSRVGQVSGAAPTQTAPANPSLSTAIGVAQTEGAEQQAAAIASPPSVGAQPDVTAALRESMADASGDAPAEAQRQRSAASRSLMTTLPLEELLSNNAPEPEDKTATETDELARSPAARADSEGLTGMSEVAERAPAPQQDAATERFAEQTGVTDESESIDEVIVTGTRAAGRQQDPNARRLANSTVRLDRQLTQAQFETLAKDNPQRALARIAALWDAGERWAAADRLETFRRLYPEYSERRLKAVLPAAMLEEN